MAPSLADLGGPSLHAALARLRAAGPVAWVPAIGGWLVTGYRAAVEVMRDADGFTVDDERFSTAQVVGPSMLSLDGAEHRRHRTPFVPMFLPGQVDDRYGARIEALVGELLERVSPLGRADLRPALSAPLAAGVMASVVGLGTSNADTVLAWYRAIVAAVTAITAGTEPGPRAAEAMGELRRRVEGSGLTDEGLAPEEVAANAAVVMFGGVETVDGEVASALAHLLARPELFDAVEADDRFLGAVVEESLRLEPAASVVDRYATRDIGIAGARIRSGDLVRVSLAGANRDPDVFPDPDRFRPDRPNLRSQLSFARGPHTCVAMELARLETRLALRAVLRTLPGVRLDGAVEVRGLVFRKPASVPARWD
ncbi:MAG: cytochrome P450 [Acidimicrobiales bacterium]